MHEDDAEYAENAPEDLPSEVHEFMAKFNV